MYIPTDEYLDEVKAREAAATPGPWEYSDINPEGKIRRVFPRDEMLIDGECIAVFDDGEYIENPNSGGDAKFIAAARQDVPNLELGCRNLKAKLAALEADLAAARAERDAAREALEAADSAINEMLLWTSCYESLKTDDGIKQFRNDLKTLQAARAFIEKALKGERK